MYFRNSINKIQSLPINEFKIRFGTNTSYGICSFMYLSYEDFCVDINNNSPQFLNLKYKNIKSYKIKSKVLNELETFKEIEEKNKNTKYYPLLFILDHFYKAITNPKRHLGFKYHEFNKTVSADQVLDYSKTLDVAVLFKKDISYSNQREYRVVKKLASDCKGEACNFPELKGYIIKYSISNLKELRIGQG